MSLHFLYKKAALTCALLFSLSFSAVVVSADQGVAGTSNFGVPESEVFKGKESSQEILRTFEREARAAYQEAKAACAGIDDPKEREICLAKAKLQFDADMRYARKRAETGY